MKKLIFSTFVLVALPIFAAEDCPVNKISLARGLACESYLLAFDSTEKDSRIDQICLKLGRVSAIMLRTQGPVLHEGAPVPKTTWLRKAHEIEGFCGIGDDKTLPRGLLNFKFLVKGEGEEGGGFKRYMRALIVEQSKWIEENADLAELKCDPPKPLKPEQVVPCSDKDPL